MELESLFLAYLMENYYDPIFDSVNDYIDDNIENINWKVDDVRPNTAELDDITGKRVIVENKPGTGLSFDIIVEADVELSEVGYHRHDSESIYEWFRVSCTGDLEKGLTDFQINTVCVYNHIENPFSYLKNNLVPNLTKYNLDNYARKLLEKYYPEALKKPVPIIPEVLAQRLGLTIEEHKLSVDGEFFGAFFFSDCDIDVYDSPLKPKKLHIKAKTAVIDPDHHPIGTLDFTKVHECMHWVIHRKHYLLEKLFNKNACQIKCSIKKNNEKTETEWLEWQANALAAHVLMPARQFKRKAHELIEFFISIINPRHEIDILDLVADDLAAFFAVSRMAVTIRMVETGFDEMLGIFNYVDNHYVKPYAFKKGYLQKFQTFSISFQDFVYTCISEPEIGAQIKSRHLIFVESHICINSPKFITYNENRIPQLTEYARYHMDECCLVFDLSVRNASANQKRIYDCALCRVSNACITFEAKINKKYSGQIIDEARVLKEYVDEVRQLDLTLPRDFKQCLETLMKWSEVTLEELSERSGIAGRTLSNLKNDTCHNMKIESVVAICLGLRLPPEISFKLVEASGVSFRLINQNEAMYKCILYAPGDWDVGKWNEKLLKANLKPLNNLRAG